MWDYAAQLSNFQKTFQGFRKRTGIGVNWLQNALKMERVNAAINYEIESWTGGQIFYGRNYL